MNSQMQNRLRQAIQSTAPLEAIVELLRDYKGQGVTQGDVYSFLEQWHLTAPEESIDDRILEVADFVAGFCTPHMKVWEGNVVQAI